MGVDVALGTHTVTVFADGLLRDQQFQVGHCKHEVVQNCNNLCITPVLNEFSPERVLTVVGDGDRAALAGPEAKALG